MNNKVTQEHSATQASWRESGSLVFITSFDPRKRHRFLVEPLRSSGFDPVLAEDSGSLLTLLFRARRVLRQHPKCSLVVLCDADIRMWVWGLAVRWFTSAKLIVRVGGDPVKVRDDKIVALKRSGNHIDALKMRLQQWASRKLFKYAHAYIAVSDRLRCALTELAPNAQSAVVPQVVNLDRVARTTYSIGDTLQLLTVTNLSYLAKYEGVKSLVSMLAEFVDRHDTNVQFTILGGGEFEDQLGKWVESKQTSKLKIDVHGFVRDTDSYYSDADVFVYFSKLEGLPNVVLEAQASALPLLINNDELFFEFLDSNEHVLFYEEGSVDSFVSKLQELSTSTQLRTDLGRANRQRAESWYSSQAVSKRLQEFFDQV